MLPSNVCKYVLFDFLDMKSAFNFSHVMKYQNENLIWKNKAKQYVLSNNNYTLDIHICRQILKLLCHGCYVVRGNQSRYHGFRLCDRCYDNKEYKLISKMDTKHKYFMDDTDIDYLIKLANKNNYATTKFFYEKDIITRFIQRYNIQPNELSNKLQQLQQLKLEQKKQNKRAKIIAKFQPHKQIKNTKLSIT